MGASGPQRLAVAAGRSCTQRIADVAKVRGAALLAPSDPDGPNYPDGPVGFGPVPMRTLPFPTIVVASSDDRYIDASKTYKLAVNSASERAIL
jgi:uncharacterized protein